MERSSVENDSTWDPQTVGADEEANKLRSIASNVSTRLIPFPLSDATGDMNCINDSSSALHFNTGSCAVSRTGSTEKKQHSSKRGDKACAI